MKTLSINTQDHKRLKRLSADTELTIKELVTLAVDALKEKMLLKRIHA